ncbi:MAG: hypothetical protein RIF41_18380 [Polyangiaceae bacterium]
MPGADEEALDTAAICAALALHEPPPPLVLEPAAVKSALAKTRDRLAAVAGYHGNNDYWELWRAVCRRLQEDPEVSVQRLSAAEAYWLASSSFSRGEVTLGLLAFEHHLESKGEAANPFATFEYFVAVLDQPERGYRALASAHERHGCRASDELARLVLGWRAGLVDRAAAESFIESLAQDSANLAQASRAVALDELGERERAEAIFARSLAEATFSASIRAELDRRFANVQVASTSEEPAPNAATRLLKGRIAVPARRRTGHVFAPSEVGPDCPGCSNLMTIWFELAISKIRGLAERLPEWDRFRAPACLRCGYWMLPHDYFIERDGRIVVEHSPPATRELAKVYAVTSVPRPQSIKLPPAPATIHDLPLDGHCQVGGSPAWIQDPQLATCGVCDVPMVFVLRFSSPNEFESCPEVGNGSSGIYYFACTSCTRFRQLAQWT